jgi:integrase
MKEPSVGTNVDTQTESVEFLKAEIDELKQQLARVKPRDLHFLGETIPGDILAELASGGKLTARGAQTRPVGMHGDGRSLWLQVTRNGRSWIFRFRRSARQREMGLGALADVSLSEARGRATICRRLVRGGVDPIERRRAIAGAPRVQAERVSFKQAAARYFENKKSGWHNDKHVAQFTSTMRDYCDPIIGDTPVQDVGIDLVMRVLEPIWTTKPETASRVRSRIEAVLDWATALNLRHGENPARWRGSLKALLPARSKVKAVVHHAALPYGEMHAFWTALQTRDSVSASALSFTILTAARSGEVLGAKWSEVDLDAKAWTVPAERMKAKRQHRVALSDEAGAVLERMKALKVDADADGFIFPGAASGRSLSTMAMAMSLRKMGRGDLTVHGFRSSFRDWAAERTAYPHEMVEMALAHVISNKAEAAYRRGDMFERRRRLMRDWARHCLTAPPEAGNLRRIGQGR